MKKILPLLFFATLFAALDVVQAQSEYHPITDGCSWSVSNEKYMTVGGTLLDGKTYLKVYRQEGSQPFEFNLEEAEYFAAIRNDSAQKKVYAYLPAGSSIRDLSDYSVTQTDTAMDVLIYDFSLEVGDTLTYYVVGGTVAAKAIAVRSESANVYVGRLGYSSVNHQYSAEDTVVYLSDNSSRHQILLHGISHSTPDNVWIEGIGGIRGFNEASQIIYSDYGKKTLLCFANNSGAEFHTEYDFDNEPDDCFNSGFGGDVKEREKMDVKVHPNPTDDLLFVELSNGTGIAHAVLYDLQGRIVETFHETSLQGGTATLSLKSVPADVYVLRVTDTEGREYHRKIVKK
jgi:hypothetical protein